MIIESNIPVIPDAKIVFSNNNYIIISNENNELKVDDLIFVKQNSNIKNINCIKHDEKKVSIYVPKLINFFTLIHKQKTKVITKFKIVINLSVIKKQFENISYFII